MCSHQLIVNNADCAVGGVYEVSTIKPLVYQRKVGNELEITPTEFFGPYESAKGQELVGPQHSIAIRLAQVAKKLGERDPLQWHLGLEGGCQWSYEGGRWTWMHHCSRPWRGGVGAVIWRGSSGVVGGCGSATAIAPRFGVGKFTPDKRDDIFLYALNFRSRDRF